MKNEPVPAEEIQARIHIVRGKRVMLDADLAHFYRVQTRDLNKAVARNPERFPSDFAFRLTRTEAQKLMFQAGTSSSIAIDAQELAGKHGGVRKPPRAFTEQGVAMLASVLRTQRAAAVSVALVRAFVQLRDLLSTHRELAAQLADLEQRVAGHDQAIHTLFETIRQLLTFDRNDREMGFHTLIKRRPPAEDADASDPNRLPGSAVKTK